MHLIERVGPKYAELASEQGKQQTHCDDSR